MFDALAEGKMCVRDLTELVGADQSTVSKHRSVLKQAGIVEDWKEGTMTFFRLKIRCLQGFWECVESVFEQNLEDRRAVVAL